MGHDHDHSHAHRSHAHRSHAHHSHAHHSHGALPRDGASGTGRAFAVGVGLNLTFVVVEAAYGVASHSMALLADAAHNLGDVLGLVLAWVASILARRKPSQTHTYGLRRSTILAALANAVLLLVATGGVCWEAIGRLRAPGPVEGWTVLTVAAVGVVINAASALMFVSHQERDANVRGAFLHLAADAAVSLGVVVAGVVMLRTGWTWVDPVVSLLVSVVVLLGTWGLFREALGLSLDRVPPHVELDAVRAYLASLAGVEAVHDLHVWPMSTTETALTAHLVMTWPDEPPAFLGALPDELHARFGIDHVTVQLEPGGDGGGCRQSSDSVV